MANSKQEQQLQFIGKYMWDKVGSKSSFKSLRVTRRNTANVVGYTSKGGLTEDVVGVFANVGNMAFFVDIDTLMSLPKYSFGNSVPNKVHMTVPLHVPLLIEQELTKRQRDIEEEDGSDWSGDSETEREVLKNMQHMHVLANAVANPANAAAIVKDPLPPIASILFNQEEIMQCPPTPAPEKVNNKPCFIRDPQGLPKFLVEEPGVKEGKSETKKVRKPRAPRAKKPQRLAAPMDIAAYEETIDQVASGMLPTDDLLVQAAADAGITIPSPFVTPDAVTDSTK